MTFPITKAQTLKPKPKTETLGFGKYFSDHMFLMDYAPKTGWSGGRIVPYGPLPLDPASMILHYGQEIFEGLKAYRRADGGVQFFRPIENIRRFNRSCERLTVPVLDEEVFMSAMTELVKLEKSWVPEATDASLYLRPFVIATDPYLGVRPSDTFLFVIILSPVGAYYSGGMSPTNILIEDEDVRAAVGGLGYAKTSANYAATLRAQERAKVRGFSQVLWLDAAERKYVEEVGTSNAFFVLDGKVVTPALSGSILPGITRDSCLALLRKWGMPVEERKISVDEVWQAAADGRLSECFASGTAAVVSPVGRLTYKDDTLVIGGEKVGPLAQKLYDSLTGLQWGLVPDDMGWIVPVEI